MDILNVTIEGVDDDDDGDDDDDDDDDEASFSSIMGDVGNVDADLILLDLPIPKALCKDEHNTNISSDTKQVAKWPSETLIVK